MYQLNKANSFLPVNQASTITTASFSANGKSKKLL